MGRPKEAILKPEDVLQAVLLKQPGRRSDTPPTHLQVLGPEIVELLELPLERLASHLVRQADLHDLKRIDQIVRRLD